MTVARSLWPRLPQLLLALCSAIALFSAGLFFQPYLVGASGSLQAALLRLWQTPGAIDHAVLAYAGLAGVLAALWLAWRRPPRDDRAPPWRGLLAQGVVTGLSLLLLAFVGYGETLRTTAQIERQQIEGQAELARSQIESALQAGIPLNDLANLDSLLQPTLLRLPGVDRVTVVHRSGEQLYPLGLQTQQQMDAESALSLPLRGRLGEVGQLTINLKPDSVELAVQMLFQPVALFIALLALLGFVLPRWLIGSDNSLAAAERRYFAVSFSLVALLLVVLMSGLYARSAHNQGEYLAQSLQQRLSAATANGIPLHLLSGLDSLLAEYQQLNPQISALELQQRGRMMASASDDAMAMLPQALQIEHRQPIAATDVELVLTLPASVILEQVARSLKNFAVLFIATWLAANLFSRLLARRNDPNLSERSQTLESLNPLFFLAILMESLHNAFLPALLRDTAAAAELGSSASSLLFMVFFVAFALTLLPAGRLSERYGARPVLISGALLAVVGAAILMTSTTLTAIIGARTLAGIGQCLMLVSVQQLILANTDDSNRTRGAAIIVTNFNASFISGTALGSLLINYLGPQGVFGIEAAVGLSLLSLALLLLPMQRPQAAATASSMASVFADCYRLLRLRPFRQAMVWVGLPAKATLTGIITFVLPLVLAEIGFVSEDIGQIIMLYAVGVLVASRYLSAWVDRVGQPGRVIAMASWVAVTAMLLLALGQWSLASLQAWWGYGMIVLAVLLLGCAHGGINAPIVSHMLQVVPEATASRQTTVTSYRFLERIGHVMGPFVCGQILVWLGYGTESLVVLGALLFIAALWFSLGARRRTLEVQ